MKCIKCGNDLRENEVFCTNCGYYNSADEVFDDPDDIGGFELPETDNPKFESKKKDFLEDYNKSLDENDEFILENNNAQKEENKNKEKPKKEKKVKEPKPPKPPKEKINVDERFIESYIGDDYQELKESSFNKFALLLSWLYYIYRGMFAYGLIGLLITGILILYCQFYVPIIFFILSAVVSGFVFNKVFIKTVEFRIKEIIKTNGNIDITNLCAEKGKTNIYVVIVIYVIFVIIVVLGIFKYSLGTGRKENFKNENAKAKDQCLMLIKDAYKSENNKQVQEAVCYIDKSNNQDYELYLKVYKNKVVYEYYKTEEGQLYFTMSTDVLDDFTTKKNQVGLLQEEEEYYQKMLEVSKKYKEIYDEAKEEDQLIQEKKNQRPKINFIYTRDEIVK